MAKSILTDRERAIIHEAAKAGLAAGMVQSISQSTEAFKDTEQRLYNFKVVSGRFFDNLHDDDIAADICCDPVTVRRNRTRLIRIIAVFLYGVGTAK